MKLKITLKKRQLYIAALSFILFSQTNVFSQGVMVSTLSGSAPGFANGTARAARFNSPAKVAVDATGNVYVSDANNQKIRKITPSGVVSTLAGSTGGFADGPGSTAQFNGPRGVAVDATGNVYVSDTSNQKIRKITPSGVVSTLAGSTVGFADGTGSAAEFRFPRDVAVDATGNVYVADTANHKIRKITPSGVVTTLAGSTFGFADGTGSAAQFANPSGVAVDATGNVYVADSSNHKIRKITPSGVVTTLAGSTTFGFADGPGSTAQFTNPYSVAVDATGNVYVADAGNNKIRKITAAGVVTTLAGSRTRVSGFADGQGSRARFSSPRGVAVDATGNLYVADTFNNRIRKITITTADADGDGINDDVDNCPNTTNADQADNDNDGIGDVCDDDDDNDGILDVNDTCPFGVNPEPGVIADITLIVGGSDVVVTIITPPVGVAPFSYNFDLNGAFLGHLFNGNINVPISNSIDVSDVDPSNALTFPVANPNNISSAFINTGNDGHTFYDLRVTDANGCTSDTFYKVRINIVFPDTDGDGVADGIDNCPNTANADQADNDNDGIGDVCDDDNYPPTVVTQDITVNLDVSGNATITPQQIDNGSSDDSGTVTLSLDVTSFDCTNLGSNTITLTGVDPSGKTTSVTAVVTVEDNILPTVVTQAFTTTITGGVATVTPQDVDGGSFDNCGIASMTVSPNTFVCGDQGDHIVTLTVTDNNANTNTATATVTVLGDVPTITIADFTAVPTQDNNTVYLGYGPQSMTLSTTTTGGAGFTYSWTASTGEIVASVANPTVSPLVSTIYTVTVLNANGCDATTSIDVCVIDARYINKKGEWKDGKVLMCKGNGNDDDDDDDDHHGDDDDHGHGPETKAKKAKDVQKYLEKGYTLGACNATCSTVYVEVVVDNDDDDNKDHDHHGKTMMEQPNLANDFAVYNVKSWPNPSSNSFNVKIVTGATKDVVNIKVFDIIGKLVLKDNFNWDKQYKFGAVLQSGVYFVRVSQAGNIKTLRVIKN